MAVLEKDDASGNCALIARGQHFDGMELREFAVEIFAVISGQLHSKEHNLDKLFVPLPHCVFDHFVERNGSAEPTTLCMFILEVATFLDTMTSSENAKFWTATAIKAIVAQALHITGPRRYSRRAFPHRTSSRSLCSTISRWTIWRTWRIACRQMR